MLIMDHRCLPIDTISTWALIFLEQNKPEESLENFLLATDCPLKKEKISTLFNETNIFETKPINSKDSKYFVARPWAGLFWELFQCHEFLFLNVGLLTLMGSYYV
jgi:hypothetical protein